MPACSRSPQSCGANVRSRSLSFGFGPSGPWCWDPVWRCLLAPSSGKKQKLPSYDWKRNLYIQIKAAMDKVVHPVSINQWRAACHQCSQCSHHIYFYINKVFKATSLNSASFMAVRSNPAWRLSYCRT